MPKHGKKYRNKVEGIDRREVMPIDEVLKHVVASSYVAFDETVDVGFIQWGVHFVKNTKRAGSDHVEGEEEGDGGQSLLSAGKKSHTD